MSKELATSATVKSSSRMVEFFKGYFNPQEAEKSLLNASLKSYSTRIDALLKEHATTPLSPTDLVQSVTKIFVTEVEKIQKAKVRKVIKENVLFSFLIDKLVEDKYIHVVHVAAKGIQDDQARGYFIGAQTEIIRSTIRSLAELAS